MLGLKRRLACSFCGKSEVQVAKLVAGPRIGLWSRVYICNACVSIASRIMAEADGPPPGPRPSVLGDASS